MTMRVGCDIILRVIAGMSYNAEVWLSLVERHVRDVEAVGSNPVTSTSGHYPQTEKSS